MANFRPKQKKLGSFGKPLTFVYSVLPRRAWDGKKTVSRYRPFNPSRYLAFLTPSLISPFKQDKMETLTQAIWVYLIKSSCYGTSKIGSNHFSEL
jgi:hypothetical protein